MLSGSIRLIAPNGNAYSTVPNTIIGRINNRGGSYKTAKFFNKQDNDPFIPLPYFCTY